MMSKDIYSCDTMSFWGLLARLTDVRHVSHLPELFDQRYFKVNMNHFQQTRLRGSRTVNATADE